MGSKTDPITGKSEKMTVEEAQPVAVKLVLEVVGIYAIFLALSALCFLGNAAKRKYRPAPTRGRRST